MRDLPRKRWRQGAACPGLVHRVRDTAVNPWFIDLRDHYGIAPQVLCDPRFPVLRYVEKVRSEWCIRIDGEVKARADDTGERKIPNRRNRKCFVRDIEVLWPVDKRLPCRCLADQEYPEETRCAIASYSHLRRERWQNNRWLAV